MKLASNIFKTFFAAIGFTCGLILLFRLDNPLGLFGLFGGLGMMAVVLTGVSDMEGNPFNES